MKKSYMVIRNGTSKKTGELYSLALNLCKSNDGKSEWLDEKDKYFANDIRPVGSVISVEQMEV